MSACTVPRTTLSVRSPALLRLGLRDLLIDRGVHEQRQHDRRRTVDRHADAGRLVTQIEAGVQVARVLEGAHADAALADLAEDVRALVGVAAVQRHRIEGGRQALGRLARR
jgi:hypothetical protein